MWEKYVSLKLCPRRLVFQDQVDVDVDFEVVLAMSQRTRGFAAAAAGSSPMRINLMAYCGALVLALSRAERNFFQASHKSPIKFLRQFARAGTLAGAGAGFLLLFYALCRSITLIAIPLAIAVALIANPC